MNTKDRITLFNNISKNNYCLNKEHVKLMPYYYFPNL